MARNSRPLDGRMVLVAGADTTRGAALARACAHDGAAVVLVGGDGESLGSLAAELTAAGARVAVFAGDPNVDSERAALAELLDELF